MNQTNDHTPTVEDVKRLAKAGDLRSATSAYRQIYHVGLKQALDEVKKLAGLPPSVPRISNLPLSSETQRRLETIFRPEHHAEATQLLIQECGNNLPGFEKHDEVSMERIRFAALKWSRGDLLRLHKAIREAKLDWRDLLCGAGFGDDAQAHKRWFPEKTWRQNWLL